MSERITEIGSDREHAHTAPDEAPTSERLTRRAARGSSPVEGGAHANAPANTVQRFADAINAGIHTRQVQLDARDGGASSPEAIQRAAAQGLSGSGGALPHLGAIQRAFGHHDVSGVRAHVGGRAEEASQAIGARAYASGDQVAFAAAPDLQLAAHEAAHVVQQRGGVRLAGGVGAAGDAYEQHADAVADLVVQGKSAQGLLDQMAHRGAAGGAAVQRDDIPVTEAVVGPHGGGEATGIPGMTISAEGQIRLFQFRVMRQARMAVGPYAFLTGVTADGMLDYSRSMPGTTTPARPSDTEIHAGPGAARGHHHGRPAVGGSAEIAHHVADLWGGSHVDLTTGGELTTREGSYGFGITGGTMQFGDLAIPLPTATVNLVQWERGEGVRFLVANLTVPIPVSRVFRIDVAGRPMELIPHLDLVFEFEPNWPVIATHLGIDVAEAAPVAEAAIAAETAGGATPEVAAAAGEAIVDTAAMTEVVALAATIAAPIGAGVVLAMIFEHEVGGMEELGARARGCAHTVFNYCAGYTTTWFGRSGASGTGSAEGAAAARRDMAAMQSAHPGVDPATQAREWGYRAIYTQVYEISTRPLAEGSMRRRMGVTPGTLDDMVIVDAVGQVRWGGGLFTTYDG